MTGSGGEQPGQNPGAGPHQNPFRLLVEAVTDYAIYMLDPQGRVASWNPGAQRIKGYTADQAIGRSFEVFHTPEDRAAHRPRAALETALREGCFTEEWWRVRQDGSHFWAHVTLTALRDRDGNHVGFAKVTRDLTERKAAEDALRASEERFRQLAENAREVFWLYNADFSRLLFVSPAFEAVWGRTTADLEADPDIWSRSVHPDDLEDVRAMLADLGEARSAGRFRIRRPDGEVRWLLSRGFPIRDEAGNVLRIGGVTEDITEQVETEEGLRFLAEAARVLAESIDYEETLRNVSRLAVPAVADWCVVDVLEEGVIRRVSVAHVDPEKEALAWESVRRYPPDPESPVGVAQVLRTGIPQVAHEISDELMRRAAQDEDHYRLMAGLGLRSFMMLPMTARGRVLGAITFIRAESGRRYTDADLGFGEEVAGRAAMAVDNARLYRLSEDSRGEAERRARQEEALRQAAQAVTAAFDDEGILRELVEHAVVATNSDAAFVKRVDAGAGEVVVAAASGPIAPPVGTRGPLDESYTRLAMSRSEPLLVPSLREAPGTVLAAVLQFCDDCSAMVVPLADAGIAIGTLVLARRPERQGFRPDELDRAQTFADLANLAFRKIHLLQESELRRQELEEAIESRARLIRGFTHDLKNPLGAADGYLQMIESGIIADPDRRELSISRTRRALRTALDLIEDLSRMALVEAGQIKIDPAPVDAREIAAELTEEYRPQAEAKGLIIDCHLPARLPLIQSDSTRIRQVLGNLISNAVKYTAEGQVEVSVAARRGRRTPGSGKWLALAVADTGRGIPGDRQHMLFREFSRIDPDGTPGVGLGLAISQRVAHALGGCITVQSEAGSGATFTLWLPLNGASPRP
jgi:PAS domain S-box-containing protein